MTEVRAEIVANIWRVAESAGVVSRLHVAAGDFVREDDLMAVIEQLA